MTLCLIPHSRLTPNTAKLYVYKAEYGVHYLEPPPLVYRMRRIRKAQLHQAILHAYVRRL